MKFDCSCCGACCRSAGCTHLTKKNLCDIYETRPTLCRVGKMYRITGGRGVVEEHKYYKLVKEFCEFLRQKEVKSGLWKKEKGEEVDE